MVYCFHGFSNLPFPVCVDPPLPSLISAVVSLHPPCCSFLIISRAVLSVFVLFCFDQSALDLTGYGGRVVLGSWYGGGASQLNLGMAFHRSHLTIQTSQVCTCLSNIATLSMHVREIYVQKKYVRSMILNNFPGAAIQPTGSSLRTVFVGVFVAASGGGGVGYSVLRFQSPSRFSVRRIHD